jgi:hypothetical protein
MMEEVRYELVGDILSLDLREERREKWQVPNNRASQN